MYSEYEIVHLDLTISVTNCSHIILNTCTFEIPCKLTDGSQCNYLRQLNNFKSNCIGGNASCNYLDKPFSELILEPDQCTTIQLNHNTDHYINYLSPKQIMLGEVIGYLCRAKNLKVYPALKEGKLEYAISGFVSGK